MSTIDVGVPNILNWSERKSKELGPRFLQNKSVPRVEGRHYVNVAQLQNGTIRNSLSRTGAVASVGANQGKRVCTLTIPTLPKNFVVFCASDAIWVSDGSKPIQIGSRKPRLT
jgi:hypothetical protein